MSARDAGPMRLVVTGATGRMGLMLIRAIAAADDVVLAAALTHAASPHLGADCGVLAGLGPLGVPFTSDPLAAVVAADGIVDFSTPAATVAIAALAAQARVAHVIGTTGLSPADLERIGAAAWHAPIVRSGNMSLGVTLLAALVRQAARTLGSDADIEVVEMHHRRKVDAPSGTALLLGAAAAEGLGVDLESHAVRSRDGHTGPRPPDAIGFASLRGGTVVGDHRVVFAAAGERVELSHIAEDRSIFALGALKAARWARGRKPGLYGMHDVLDLGPV